MDNIIISNLPIIALIVSIISLFISWVRFKKTHVRIFQYAYSDYIRVTEYVEKYNDKYNDNVMKSEIEDIIYMKKYAHIALFDFYQGIAILEKEKELKRIFFDKFFLPKIEGVYNEFMTSPLFEDMEDRITKYPELSELFEKLGYPVSRIDSGFGSY